MYSYHIVLSLPSFIQSKLASFCYGLPYVRWTEEDNFQLILRSCGQLSDITLSEVQQRLHELFFLPFSLHLQGIGQFRSKGNRGMIWIGVSESASLISLKKSIDSCLKEIKLPSEERAFTPCVILGYMDRIIPKKWEDYFLAHAAYQSDPIHITHCDLMRVQQTNKHTLYETIEEYPAFCSTLGED